MCDLAEAGDFDGVRALDRELRAGLRRALGHHQSHSAQGRARAPRAPRGRAPAAAGRGDRRATCRAALRPCGERPDGRRVSDLVRIIPLGGLGEIGKNMTASIEQGERRILIDCGLSFPRDEMLGVDLVLPDFAYLREAPGGIDAVILTHGHEDHIGALPYVMREIGVREVWGTRLTLGMVKSKLDEHGLLRDAEFIEIDTERRSRRVRAVRGRVRARHALGARRRRGRAAHPPRHDPAHRRLQDRPHADRRPADRSRQARALRRRRRRPHAGRLHERRAARASRSPSSSSRPRSSASSATRRAA